MATSETLQYMHKIRTALIDYFTEQANTESTALGIYDKLGPIESQELPDDVKKLREVQSIVLRDRINELNKHIAVIKRIFPDA